ncbi:hypothetical protein [Thaumasiovibrio subtropicus]|uniref:hypothetical protein n=1 Tax=Thaumasiovibrio subtropicus TaxID=1891207 RepID=UPI000B3632D9|nr:hypothetical protein [Thaumasiovibrio subtropicus]
MSLKNQLPAGDARNKIEFLADHVGGLEIEVNQQIKTINETVINLGGGEAEALGIRSGNLLMNGNFTRSHDMAPGGGPAWFNAPSTYSKAANPTGIVIGEGRNIAAPAYWNIETDRDLGTLGANAEAGMVFSGSSLIDEATNIRKPCVFNMALSGSEKAMLYQPFRIDNIMEYGPFPGVNYAAFSAYFSGYMRVKNSFRFGVIALDKDWKFNRIVKEQTVEHDVLPRVYHPNWLHGLYLAPGQNYAFFVEFDASHHGSFERAWFCEAGVYFNPSQEPITPTFESPQAPMMTWGKLHKTGVNTYALPNVPFIAEPHRHLLISPSVSTQATATTASIDGNVITVDSPSTDLEYYWSRYPMKCGFYG